MTLNSKSVSIGRLLLKESGLKKLPDLRLLKLKGKNGEELATDEAAVWKRVIQYNIAKAVKPTTIFETHPGLGISKHYYKKGHQAVKFFDQTINNDMIGKIEILDIDPFGQPWEFIKEFLPYLNRRFGVLLVSNGETYAVRRNLKSGQKFPTKYFGKKIPLWVTKEYIPRLEKLTKLRMKFFYVFPTTTRVILSNRKLPEWIWEGCPNWMWWLSKYQN